MSVQAVFKSTWGLKVSYLAFSGLVLAGVIAHAQYIVKVGEVLVLFILPLTLAFLLAYSCGNVQELVERGMRAKKLRPTFGKGSESKYWFNSLTGEVMAKTCIYTFGGFAGIYFLLATILLAAPPLIAFVVSIDVAGVLMLLVPARIQDRQVITKKR